MKFVALAITLLLAVGCQAASLQADAPSSLAHARAVVDVYLTQMKESVKNALGHLDDTEYKEFKDVISLRLDDLHLQLKTVQESVAPVTDGVVATLSDVTQTFRDNVKKDVDALEVQLAPYKTKLNEVVNKHIEEYRALLEPVITEYQAQHDAQMNVLKAKLEPIVEDLRNKISVNVEETKTALVPIIEAVRTKVDARLVELREMIGPYVGEYKDQIGKAYAHARSIKAEDLTALREKINPLVEDVKTKLQTIFQNIFQTFSASEA
ncbi:apolipoprotein A-Ib [Syngnathus typhle]|uniref:apolipoprotein A-Ib n=1 Tax=Syngnathus typhle TaxID=161592 RepID=UPI002A6A89D9|nr:apolipoprotein A-Ib [Syngnathus typhle]